MKSMSLLKIFFVSLAAACALLCGCGGGSSNVVTVMLTDTLGQTVVLTQADTITGTVTGPNTVNGVVDLKVTFACTFTTTTTTGTTTKTNPAKSCDSANGAVGALSNAQDTTVVYTAPSVLPDPTTFQGLIIIITGTADVDKSKTGTINLALNSGISVTITPSTAAIALGEQKLFSATLTADTTPNDVTWNVTNTTVNTGGTPAIDNTFNLNTPTCAPGCGSIDATGLYVAPGTLPTNTSVIIFAIAKKDTNRAAIANVTLVTGGVIVFKSLWPTVVPQGGSQADIFLNATNLTSQIGATLTNNQTNQTTVINAGSDALKVFFTPSSLAATTGPVSTGARFRLTPLQLATAGTYTINITPGNAATQGPGNPIIPHTFTVIPVRPGLVATTPADIPQGSTQQNITIDGGYYGPLGAPIVGVTLNGQAVPVQPTLTNSDPRRLTGQTSKGIPASSAGLFPLIVTNSSETSVPNTVFGNISVLPSYASSTNTSSLPSDLGGNQFKPCTPLPTITCTTDANGNTFFQACTINGCPAPPVSIPLGVNTKPSAIAVDSILNLGAVTEAGTDMVQFINLGSAPPPGAAPATPPTLLGAFRTGPAGVANLPTGVAIDHHVCAKGTAADPNTGQCPAAGPFQDIVAVVNYEAQTLAVLTIPGGTLLETIPLNNLIPPSGSTDLGDSTSPFPYSVGIDPFTHRALVAFASTNGGFVVNLDPSQSPSICLPGFAPGDGTSYCPVAFVELNTGTNPHVAFEPGAHLAYVTPGGAGTLTAVNLSSPSIGPLKIASAQRTANIVTVTMAANTQNNLVPGSQATVFISGLPPGANSSFNGAFSLLTVISNVQFTYAQVGANDTTTSTGSMQGFLSTGTNFLTFGINPTIQAIDINPITHSAVLGDPNASIAQVTFIDSLDEQITSLNLCQGLNLSSTTQQCSPELGTSAVAYQPFTNTVASLNSLFNQISLLDPSGSQRVTIVPTGQTAASSICFPATPCGATPIGAGATTVALSGAIAVDPINNVALAVNSGSGTITPLYLGAIQPLQIESIVTPPVDNAKTVANPAIIAQSVLIDSATPTQSVSGVQIFGRGFSAATAVRLDGVALPPSAVTFSAAKPNELDVTIPRTNGSQNILTGPRNFGLDVANPGNVTSNVMDFRVVESVQIPACAGVASAPGGVAVADDLVGTERNYFVVTETACKQAALVSLNPDATFGTIVFTIPTGGTPVGVATIPRFGYAVVANNADGTASVLDLTKGVKAVATDVSVGTSPTGVAIEQENGLAVVANTGSNTATVIDLTPLQLATPGTLAPLTAATGSEPIAVAIDPDRGANANGLAVVTALNISSSPATGQLDSLDLSVTAPTVNQVNIGTIGATPTGIVFDPASSPVRLFYASESDSNSFIAYNPDTLGASTIQVGINPASIAYNFQTSTILTVNSTSNTVSIVDAQTFQTQATLGIGGVSLFSVAIEPFSNLAIIADQQNNRVLLFPMPH